MEVKITNKKIERNGEIYDGFEIALNYFQGWSPGQENWYTVGINGGLTKDEFDVLLHEMIKVSMGETEKDFLEVMEYFRRESKTLDDLADDIMDNL